MTRDELARSLYVGVPLTKEILDARRTEWDTGVVTDEDRRECYAWADEKLADGEGWPL